MALIKLQRPSGDALESKTAACVTELINSSISFHKLHLKVTGLGSYAQHKALNEAYDAMPGHADDLAEGFQGAAEKLVVPPDVTPRVLTSVEDALVYLRELKEMVNSLQAIMPYTEIVNDLDNIKSTINSIKYQLLFLK